MNRLTREEAARLLGCSMSSLYALEKSGQLNGTYYQIGRRRFYITAKLEEWMNKGGSSGSPETSNKFAPEKRGAVNG